MSGQDEAAGPGASIRSVLEEAKHHLDLTGRQSARVIQAYDDLLKLEAAYQEIRNIEIHLEMLLDDDMRADAYADKTHSTDFQVFRVLGGYHDALGLISRLKAKNSCL